MKKCLQANDKRRAARRRRKQGYDHLRLGKYDAGPPFIYPRLASTPSDGLVLGLVVAAVAAIDRVLR